MRSCSSEIAWRAGSVASALETGIVPTVYGLRWEGLLPDGAWGGEYIPNEDLPATYRAAGVVLNDHWDDMRSEGLLSNRLFDLVACGARVVSDDVPGIRDVFGDAVLTFRTPTELAAAVAPVWPSRPNVGSFGKKSRSGYAATIASMRGRDGWWRWSTTSGRGLTSG